MWSGSPRRTAVLLHLGLVQVPLAEHQAVARLGLQLLEQPVVPVVVLLDDLERPPALDHVAADQPRLDLARERVVAGLAQEVDGLAEGEVAHAGQPVEGVQVAAGVLDDLERLGQLAEGLHGRVVDPLGPAVLGGGQVAVVMATRYDEAVNLPEGAMPECRPDEAQGGGEGSRAIGGPPCPSGSESRSRPSASRRRRWSSGVVAGTAAAVSATVGGGGGRGGGDDDRGGSVRESLSGYEETPLALSTSGHGKFRAKVTDEGISVPAVVRRHGGRQSRRPTSTSARPVSPAGSVRVPVHEPQQRSGGDAGLPRIAGDDHRDDRTRRAWSGQRSRASTRASTTSWSPRSGPARRT